MKNVNSPIQRRSKSENPSVLAAQLVESVKKQSSWIDVTQPPYNAVGDGVSNDAAAIQSAHDALSSNGGILFFPPNKVFKIGDSSDGLSNDVPRVSITKSHVKILGYGSTILNGVTRGISTFKILGTDISIEGLKFNGQNNSVNQVHIGYTAKQIELRKCEIANCLQQTGDTVVASGIMISCGVNDVAIDNCYIHHIDAPITKIARGIYASGYDAGGNTIFTGIHIRNCLITDVTPYDDADGIQLTPIDISVNCNSSIVNCKFIRCAKRGIKAQGSGIVIDGNFINLGAYGDGAQTMYSGISVYGNDIKVINNEIVGDYSTYGIDVGSLTTQVGLRTIISNNVIKLLTQGTSRGIYVVGNSAVVDVIITSNIINKVQTGIYLDTTGNRATILGNSIDNVNSAIFNNKTLSQISVIGNALTNMTQYAVRNANAGTQVVAIGNTSDLTGLGMFANASDRISSVGNMIVGTPVQLHGNQIPTTGAWKQGDIIWNTSVAAGGKAGWMCVTTGSPGTWKAFGVVDA